MLYNTYIMKVLSLDIKNKDSIIDEAVAVLKNGGLVIYPTETCYGVAVQAINELAVAKLLKYKRRPEGKAISIAVVNMDMAEKYVELNKTAENIYEKFLPGPVTVVSMSKGKVVKGLEAEDATLGVRIPDYNFTLDLIEALGDPITATSANSSGKKTPYAIADIFNNLSQKQLDLIDLVIDVGELPHNPPSTVIDTTKEELKVLRHGDVNLASASKVLQISNSEAMQEQGQLLIRRFKNLLSEKPMLVMFNADLGAGKTQFIKGMAKELCVKELVNSPTFVLLKEYGFEFNNAPGKLIHLDAWRLESVSELSQMNLEGYFKKGNVIAVEWAGMAKEYLESLSAKLAIIKVYIEISYTSLNERELSIYE